MPRENGCTGACCREFWLPFDHAELKAKAERGEQANGSKLELKRLVEVVVPLDLAEHGVEVEGGKATRWPYTCRVWDPETRLCKEYDRRPIVCRRHPVSKACGLDPACRAVPGPDDEARFAREFEAAMLAEPAGDNS